MEEPNATDNNVRRDAITQYTHDSDRSAHSKHPASVRRDALKRITSYYNKENKYTEAYDEDWQLHARKFENLCRHFG